MPAILGTHQRNLAAFSARPDEPVLVQEAERRPVVAAVYNYKCTRSSFDVSYCASHLCLLRRVPFWSRSAR
jgi:hypothetical protein